MLYNHYIDIEARVMGKMVLIPNHQAPIESYLEKIWKSKNNYYKVVRCSLKRCISWSALLHEWSAALQFKEEFDFTLTGFSAALKNHHVAGYRKYIITINDFNEILIQNDSDFKQFILILNEIIQKRPDFGFIAQVHPDAYDQCIQRLKSMNIYLDEAYHEQP